MKKTKSRSIVRILVLALAFAVAAAGILAAFFRFVLPEIQSRTGEASVVSPADESASQEATQPAVVSLDVTSAETGKGLTFQLAAEGGEGIVYRSSDISVASVDNSGLIRGVGVGQCTVTAESKDGSRAECSVTVKKTCYLTIDDGPRESTEDILAVLKEYDVKATFFVVNSNYLHLTKDMLEQGHAVGLHSYSHRFKECYASEYSYLHGIELISAKVEGYTGKKCNLLRFPGGTGNTRCDPLWMRRNLSGAEDLGFRVFDWTATTGDSSQRASAEFSFANVKKTCTEDVEIILMHDRFLNVPALKNIIPYLREQGYVFATLDRYPEKSMHAVPVYSRQHRDEPATSVYVTHKTFSLDVGEDIRLVARMSPSKSTDYVRWESADPTVAAVSLSGTVTGVRQGETDIYAVTSSGQRGVCHMTVR